MTDMPQGTTRSYGAFELGRFRIAIATEYLVQAAIADHLVDLPTHSHLVRGGLLLRGQVIPVVDLSEVLGHAGADRDSQCIAVVAVGDRTLGIRCTKVAGFIEVPDVDVTATEDAIVSRYFVGEDGESYTLIGVDSLLEAVPESSRSGAPSPQAPPHLKTSSTERCILVEAGAAAIALPTSAVHCVYPFSQIQPTTYQSGPCLGSIHFRGRDIPALDLLDWAGLPGVPHQGSGDAIVLSLDNGYVALVAQRVLDIARVPRSIISPIQPLADRESCRVTSAFPSSALAEIGVARSALRPDSYLLIEAEEIASNQELERYGSLDIKSKKHGSQSEVSAHVANQAPMALTFFAGIDLATPVDQVLEIAQLPEQEADQEADATGDSIVFRRGAAVLVRSLEALLGLEVQPGRRHVLIVQGPVGRVGYSVGILTGLERCQGEREFHLPTPQMRQLFGRRCLLLGSGTATKTLPRIDLKALAEQQIGSQFALAS